MKIMDFGKAYRIRRGMRAPAAVLTAAGLAAAGAVLAIGPASSAAGATSASTGAASAAATTAEPYSCAPNGPAGSQTIYGTFGDSGVIGWTGNTQAVVACLGGSFFVDTSPADAGPGSGSTAAVTGTTYGYGIYNDTRTTWANADGYLPALVTTFSRDGARVSITNFGDKVTIGGHAFVVVYSRVAVTNPTGRTHHARPAALPGPGPAELALRTPLPPHGSGQPRLRGRREHASAASYPLPSASALADAGGFDQHFAHMTAYWNGAAGRHRADRPAARREPGRRLPDRLHLHPDHPVRRRAEDRRQRLRQGVQPRRHRHPGQPVQPGLHHRRPRAARPGPLRHRHPDPVRRRRVDLSWSGPSTWRRPAT